MTEDPPDVVVLRSKAHGISSKAAGPALRERLPDHDIRVATTPVEERELIRQAPVAHGLSISEELLDHAEELRYFACAAAGPDHVPIDELAERDIALTNASGVHVPNIAEHVIGWMLMIGRRLDDALRRQIDGEPRHFQAFGELNNSTVTVVGLGALGHSIVKHLEPFDTTTIGVRYTPSKGGPTDEVIGFDEDDFHDALARTDYLILCCPLTDTTRHLIADDEFETLPTDAVVINVGRGPIIETDALITALRRNKIHKAALDVTDPEPLPANHPLYNLKNVLLTPHVSGHTEAYWERNADIVAENIERAGDTGEFDNLRNQLLPE